MTLRLCATCSLGTAGAAVPFPAAEASHFPSPHHHVRNILPAFIVTHVGARLLIRSGTERSVFIRAEREFRERRQDAASTTGNTRLLLPLSVVCPSLSTNCGNQIHIKHASMWALIQMCTALPSGCTGLSHPSAKPVKYSTAHSDRSDKKSHSYCQKPLTL